jgi:aspartate/methionine/tyrosine aminotransferase
VNQLEFIHLFPFILGAMYMLIRIDIPVFRDIEDDKDFFTKLLCEESISCLPASVK